jgi:hypothetical protein
MSFGEVLFRGMPEETLEAVAQESLSTESESLQYVERHAGFDATVRVSSE